MVLQLKRGFSLVSVFSKEVGSKGNLGLRQQSGIIYNQTDQSPIFAHFLSGFTIVTNFCIFSYNQFRRRS